MSNEQIHTGKLSNILSNRKDFKYLDKLSDILNMRIPDYASLYNSKDFFTSHSYMHLMQVEEIIYRMLGDDEANKLSSDELFLLICAIYYHDCGMAISGRRMNHHIESENFVNSNAGMFINANYALLIGKIIRSHGEDDLEALVNNTKELQKDMPGLKKVEIGSLMALLRMGDLLDTCKDRAPEEILKEREICGLSILHWTVHSWIADISFEIDNSDGESTILMHAEPIGPYSARVLQEKIKYINAQLEINRKYLKIVNCDYQSVKWDTSTQTKMAVYLKKIDSRKFLEPFVEFDKDAYLYLHGRDRDEDELIKRILYARADNKVAVFIGPSRIGKTSLIRGRICPAFSELGFHVIYDKASGDMSILKRTSEQESSNGQIVIIDQAERLLTGDDSSSIIKYLSTIRTNMDDDRKLYILFVVRKDCYTQFEDYFNESGINTVSYFMNHTLGLDVIKKLLNDNEIDYSDDILCEIDNHLSITEQNDLTTLQIVVSSILKTNPILLVDEENINKEYGSIKKMASRLLYSFFDDLFRGLTSNHKELLIAACNTMRNGTIRAKNPRFKTEMAELCKRRIITMLEDDSYEFVHDSLAEYFCSKKLDEKESELLNLKIAIIECNTTPDILHKIQQFRMRLVQLCHFSDKAVGNLVYYYARENNIEQMEFWFKNYATEDVVLAVLDRFVDGLRSLLQQPQSELAEYRRVYKDCISSCNSILKITEKQLGEYVFNNRKVDNHYLYFCVIDDLSLIFPKNTSAEITIPKKETIHDTLLVEPSFDPLFREIYYILKRHNLLEGVVKDASISHFWLERINSIIINGIEESFFYKISNNAETFDNSQYSRMVSVLLNLLSVYDVFSSYKIINGHVIYQAGIFTMKPNDGDSYTIKFDNHKDKIIRFVFNENLQVAIMEHKGTVKPIALMKHFSQDSFSLFRRKDVEKVIRKYKIYYNDSHENPNFDIKIRNFLGNRIGKWNDIEQKLKDSWENIPDLLDGDLGIFPSYVPKTAPLYSLLACLCIITYANLNKRDKYHFAKIILMKNKHVSEKSMDLYDSFYIELSSRSNSKKMQSLTIDPYRISGVNNTSTELIEFVLPIKSENNDGVSWIIDHEIEHQNNAENTIAVIIGNEHDQLLERYKHAFSYFLFWDDRINRVSKAVDEWEYELNKLLKVLQTNPFITDIFIIGNVINCKKGVSYLLSHCKHDNNDSLRCINLIIDKKSFPTSELFLFDGAPQILKNRYVHIIHTEGKEDNENNELLNMALNNYYSKLDHIVNYQIKTVEKGISANEDSAIADYITEKIRNAEDTIIAESLDDAYRQALAMLSVYGERKFDSYKKRIRELKGILLVIPNVVKCGYTMHYRQEEINSYYQSQWINENGDIYRSVHAHQELKVNQLDIIINSVIDTIRKKKGNRKLMFSFYIPTVDTVTKFEIPSLLQCNIFLRYEEETIYLDSIFTWRTNECILGLPMSLESGIRWLDEIVITEINNRFGKKMVQLGTYKYVGINMHCFDNEIAKNMIAKIIKKGNH